MKIRLITLILAAAPLFFSSNIYAQDESDNGTPIYNWDLTAKAGASLLWGDAASSYSPFTKWFSNECAFTGELVLNRRISNAFGIQVGFAKGVLSGYREVWSSDTHPVTSSKTDYFDYHLGLNVDFTALFGAKPDRLISIYAFGGVGMINFKANSYLDGMPHNSASGNTLMIPWGGGVKFRLSPRFSLGLETNFRNTFVDNIDAYEGSGSNVNDIYSITGIGLTYRFGEKKQKVREIEVVPVAPIDTVIADNQEFIAPTPAIVKVQRGLPVSGISDTTYTVRIAIQKEDLSKYARYTQYIPQGFVAREINSNGGQFKFVDQVLTIDWMKIDESELLEFSYLIVSSELEVKTYVFEGNFKYEEDTALRIVTFIDNIVVSSPAVDQVADNAGNNTNSGSEISGVDYRVQVAAVFGGKSSSSAISQALNVNEEVYEDPFNNGYRYTVGHHDQYDAANNHLKNVPVKGAYVIAFVDGKYVGNLAKTNTNVMDKAPFNTSGETYKIQIAGSKGRPYSIAKLARKYGLNPSDIYETQRGSWYTYSIGKYSSRVDAQAALSQMQNKVKGAYIVKFIDGQPSR